MGQKIGYARVSTDEQELHLQIDALIAEGCAKENIYTDKVSGAKSDRPGLEACMKTLQEGDTLVVWRLDRLGRSMAHLISLVESLMQRKVGFKSIQDGAIDTTTASGELMFNIFGALAQFERRLIQERTNAGLKAARARGRLGGRPKIPTTHPKVQMAKQMHQNQTLSIDSICESLSISRATFYRYLAL
ncbi:recombinase family protein [Vibrio sp. 10N.261.46.A3]|uniref:recombinase family protein n=1 Tax=Vibrio sp. 10N.261.46.A3 TaxID=3229658 RepID=UPI00354C053C